MQPTIDRTFARSFALSDHEQAMRSRILSALRAFVEQRPRLEFANYGDVSAYRSDSRKITQQLQDARELLRAVEHRQSLDVPALLHAALGDRLDIVRNDDTSWSVDFTPCQYWAIEFRAAVCRVLARALWAYWRADGLDPRKAARQHLGLSLARRWFA